VPKRVKTRDSEIFKIGESYYFRGTVNGIRIDDKKLVGSTFTIAKENKDNFKSELERVGLAALQNKSGHLFDKFVTDREKEFELGEIRERTFREARDLIRLHLKPYFQNMLLAEIEDNWLNYKIKKKGMDLSNHRKVLTTFLKWCRKKKYIKYFSELELKKPVRRERINLTDDEISQFFEYILKKEGHTPVLSIGALLMGPRGDELRKLRKSQVDFEALTMILKEVDTKTKKPRVIPIHPYLAFRLQLIIDQHRNDELKTEFFFPNQRDVKKPMSAGGWAKTFEKHRVGAGLTRKFTLHDLRATIEGRAHMDTRFTDKQREDMFGSSTKIQKDIYAKLNAEQLRGLLSVMKNEALDTILNEDQSGRIGDKNECG
jgi:integrase